MSESIETSAIPGQEPPESRIGCAQPNGCVIINSVHEPRTLWIGCSDARVPESVMWSSTWVCQPRCRCPVPPIPGCRCSVPPIPGCNCVPPPRVFPPDQIFVHRNIANQFHLTDNNAISVLTYGVTGIKDKPIKEIRVVGHTDCGGVKACYDAVRGSTAIAPDSVLWAWLGPLRELAARHRNDTIDQLAVRNVRLQMQNVKEVLGRLRNPSEVQVKGYIYNVVTGRLVSVAES